MPSYLIVATPSRWWNTIARRAISVVSVAVDAAVVIAVSLLTGSAYHELVYGSLGSLADFVAVGFAAASIFTLPGVIHGEYAVSHYFSFKPHLRRVFTLWNVTFLCLLALGFLIKTTEEYSRGSMILFYVAGLPTICLARYALVRSVIVGSKVGLIAARRVFLVGTEQRVTAFLRRYQPWNAGLQIAGAAYLNPMSDDVAEARQALAASLKGAIDSARSLAPDSVFVIAPWSDVDTINTCVEELQTIPVEIHLGPERIFDRFDKVRIANFGSMATLQLTRSPLSALEVIEKRIFDVVISVGALIVLAPLLACVAIMIRLDSPGPAFFLQRRYGFNQQPFRIIKFRTMTTLEDGDVIPQARHDDLRITRVGRWLRQWNADELPQLLNVLKGDMSLVGPRPHALCHDREFEQRISLYARRHNVRPGITGWAQVNGLRGETDTDEKMRRRVDFDLYYIDNWSMLFDLRILLLTVFSRSSYRNAV
jgi:Undecaprenyl-phosphate glucose phosphotransferase